MPTYSKKIWTTEEEATSTGLNQMSDNIELALRSKSSDIIFAKGQGMFTFNGSDFDDLTFTFASDADGGDPNFATTPYVFGTLVYTGDESPNPLDQSRHKACFLAVITVSTTGFSFRLYLDGGAPPSTEHISVSWIAIGT